MNPYGNSSLVGTAAALIVLSIIAVCLRFYSRFRVRSSYIGVDDWLILLAVVLVCGQCIIQILTVVYGAGARDLRPDQTTRQAMQEKLSHAVVVIEKLTYTSIKLSVLFLYRRIFKSNRTFRILNGGLIVFVCIWGLVFLFLESFVCMAYSPPFDPDQPWLSKLHNSQSGLSCPAQEWVLLWFAITEVLSDVAILSLPYPHIKRLQKSKSTKIGLCVIFGLGAVSTAIGLIRLGYVSQTFYYYFHAPKHNPNADAPGFWTTVEVGVGVITACLPPLGALLKKAIPGGSRSHSTPYVYGGPSSGNRGYVRGSTAPRKESLVQGTMFKMTSPSPKGHGFLNIQEVHTNDRGSGIWKVMDVDVDVESVKT